MSHPIFLSAVADEIVRGEASTLPQTDVFLRAQADYLTGLASLNATLYPDPIELHFVCTNDFDGGWVRFLRAWLSPEDPLVVFYSQSNKAAQKRNTHRTPLLKRVLDSPAFYSDEAKRYVREVLYADDYKLFRHFCGAPTKQTAAPRTNEAAPLNSYFPLSQPTTSRSPVGAEPYPCPSLSADGRCVAGSK